MTRTAPSFTTIVAIEERLAPLLRDRRSEPLDPRWIEAERRWSAAVWAAAAALGPAELTAAEIEQGLDVAGRPLFLCGAHRSGTTLLRDLLDGHPALTVLPSEGTYYTHFEPRLAGLTVGQQAAEMGREWLRRLVNPINQPPFWLLGRSSEAHSPYVEFARAFLAWWQLVGDRGGAWRLAAVALAWARTRGESPAMWAEKTPTNERFLDRLWAEFPQAKVIQVVRRPESVLASHKALLAGRWGFNRATAAVFRNLARSFAIAREQERGDRDRYLLVRFEELVEAREDADRRIAGFLGVAPDDAMLEPTVAGLPASANSSFAGGRRDMRLTSIERDLLALALGADAEALGYGRIEPATPVGRIADTLVSGRRRGAGGR